MTTVIEVALTCSGVGFLLAIPCIIDTTPITMCLFFFFGIPLVAFGFLLYAYAVFKDLRRHQVI